MTSTLPYLPACGRVADNRRRGPGAAGLCVALPRAVAGVCAADSGAHGGSDGGDGGGGEGAVFYTPLSLLCGQLPIVANMTVIYLGAEGEWRDPVQYAVC